MQNLRRYSFADAAPDYTNAVADDFFSHDGIADNGVSHGTHDRGSDQVADNSFPDDVSDGVSHDCVPDDIISDDVAHAIANGRTASSGNLRFRGCCERGLLL